MNAEAIAKALGKARRTGGGWLTFCPAHDNRRTPALSLADGEDGRLLAHCFGGCDFSAIMDALRVRGLTPGREQRIQLVRAVAPRPAGPDRTLAARAIWDAALPPKDTLVESYLRNRGIHSPMPATLRFHPALRHPGGASPPALVAAIQTEGRTGIQGVHRIWLAPPGRKAALDPVKAMLGACRGGAVRLSDGPAGRLTISEGIEDGLSLLAIADGPVWAAPSASFMAGLAVPSWARELWIAPDHDAAGLAAAEALARRARLGGRQVRIVPPPTPGTDWNATLAVGAGAP